jgi:hypothetical protein
VNERPFGAVKGSRLRSPNGCSMPAGHTIGTARSVIPSPSIAPASVASLSHLKQNNHLFPLHLQRRFLSIPDLVSPDTRPALYSDPYSLLRATPSRLPSLEGSTAKMSDFLDKEDQINAFIRAMNARTALSRPTPVSQASFSAAPPQAVILTPPTETEEDVLDEDESEDSILEGGMQLTSEGWNADTPTAVDTEEERDQALEQVRSAMTETQINHQDLGRTFSTAVTPDAVSSSNSNVGSSPTQESTSTRPRGHTTASSSTIVSGVRPPPPTPQMAAQTDFSTDSHTGDAVQTILGAFASSSPHNLADSIHAPHHVRTNENGNRPILLSSIHKVMEENRSKQLATVYETDPHTGHNAPSKIDDNASAFIAAMNAKMNPSKAKSSGSSAKTVSSDSTVTAASTLSTVTVKNQENKPFGKEEARGLLTSPMKTTFNESHEGTYLEASQHKSC